MALVRFVVLLFTVACGLALEGTPPTTTPIPAETAFTEPRDEATWHGSIAPLLADRCGACHRDGGIGPFSIERYGDVVPWGAAVADAVMTGRMPPFFATDSESCDVPLEFVDDVRLTLGERARVQGWVEAGMPEGDPSEAQPVELRTPMVLEDPNSVLPIPAPFTVSGNRDIYQCFRIPLEHAGDIWIDGVEVLPDNDLVVHHVLVWHDPDDLSAEEAGPDGSYRCSGQPDVWPSELIAAWTPGGSPMIAPENTGTLVHEGASLVVNIHYHPTGTTTEVDQSAIAVRWRDTQPAQHVTWYLMDIPFGATPAQPPFRIPAGAADHVEVLELEVPEFVPFDLPVFAITPHMHYLGTDMQVTVSGPRHPGDTCLISAEDYRFDYQTSYIYDRTSGELPVVRPGDVIRVTCTYDNSPANPSLGEQLEAAGVTEPIDVRWGESTSDEMCMAMVGLIIPPVDWIRLAEQFF